MNKNDLRYQKTEENLQLAYLSLMGEKECRTITVKEICQRAKCSRNTFYLHYDTKDGLYREIITRILDSLAAAFEPKAANLNQISQSHNKLYTDGIIDSIIEHKEAIAILIARDNGLFLKLFTDTIFEKCLTGTQFLAKDGLSSVNHLYVSYLASAVTGFIFEWLKQPSISDSQAKKLLYDIHKKTIDSSLRILQQNSN
ncbi:TetR/AcrR family transcriptional regulator [Streptococcus pantholopis]|uniref:HTH tetR-type domain-containing protein n=1 Tax=Streptococcus pantholopis TaxID=1811193 RepID=A0A172Q8A6_9STRE|nr:TetR family transcriptional regulator [Streptococcus pantholopis]AND79696.1 hypothetical protein A0O21_06490 [Streptococcus pantholopis]